MINKISSVSFESAKLGSIKPKKVQRVIKKVQTGVPVTESAKLPLRGEIEMPKFDAVDWTLGCMGGFWAAGLSEAFYNSSF